jgi:enoyl-CoA hydratase/carnithine racemase
MTMGPYTQILYDVKNHVATITLNRPEQMNAFTNVMLHEMLDALERVDADDAVRVLVVTGAGRAFCAGMDLSGGGDTFADGGSDVATASGINRDGGGMVALRLYDLKKPVIAAMNGTAAGVGITMTLPMDIRIAADNAKFVFPFVRRGIVPESCSSWFLPRLVGIAQASEWIMTGRVFLADEALRGGLVRSVHSPDQVLPTAYALAREIADNAAPVSVALSRQLLWRMLGAAHPMAAHEAESRGVQLRGPTADAKEGVESFLEKRAPHFPLTVPSDLPNIFRDWRDPEFQ